MMKELESLGCDIERINNRFMGDQELYEECFQKFVSSKQMEQLGQLLEAEDIREAFLLAHNLKGSISNLELTPLVKIIINIVELLRQESMEGVPEEYSKLMEVWQIFKKLSQA